MLLGRYKHTVDNKNRFMIPSKFRGAFTDRCVLSRDIKNKCVNMYPIGEWEAFTAKINSLPKVSMSNIIDFLLFNSFETEIDSQGRVIINPAQCKEVSINKEIIVIGHGNYVQLWDIGEWTTHNDRLNSPEVHSEMLKQLIDAGF